MKKIILIVALATMGLIIFSLFSNENINSLDGGFEQVGFIRNENNTGPVNRVYAFTVEDTLWVELQKHADLLPHTKYGKTTVYYFLKDDVSKSKLRLELTGIDSEVQPKCIAVGVKDGQSRIQFSRYPF